MRMLSYEGFDAAANSLSSLGGYAKQMVEGGEVLPNEVVEERALKLTSSDSGRTPLPLSFDLSGMSSASRDWTLIFVEPFLGFNNSGGGFLTGPSNPNDENIEGGEGDREYLCLMAGFGVRELDMVLKALDPALGFDLDVPSESDDFVEVRDWKVIKDDLLVFLTNCVGIVELKSESANFDGVLSGESEDVEGEEKLMDSEGFCAGNTCS